MNLFINARQAMLNDDSITVYCSNSQDSKSVKISVQDDGEGIESDIIKSIFNPFFTTKQNGTGLGLHIVKNIIETHNGSITVESEPHRGTAFTILLPGVLEFEKIGITAPLSLTSIPEKVCPAMN